MRIKVLLITILLTVASIAGVVLITPLFGLEAAGYGWSGNYYNPAPQQNMYYNQYNNPWGYSMPSYNVPAGWTVSCPGGYIWTGSVCLLQSMAYGNTFGFGGGYFDSFSPAFHNAHFFDSRFDDDDFDDFDFDDDDDDDDNDDDDIRVDVRADDTSIDEGDSTRIRWEVDGDADECRASNSEDDNDFEGQIDEDGGSERVSPDEDTTYTVRCENGDSDSDSVTIRVDED